MKLALGRGYNQYKIVVEVRVKTKTLIIKNQRLSV